MMTLDEILLDIHALEEDIIVYERKYGVLTGTFYESYINGEEPPDDAWAGACEILLCRREQYQEIIIVLRECTWMLSDVIARTAHHESLPIPA